MNQDQHPEEATAEPTAQDKSPEQQDSAQPSQASVPAESESEVGVGRGGGGGHGGGGHGGGHGGGFSGGHGVRDGGHGLPAGFPPNGLIDLGPLEFEDAGNMAPMYGGPGMFPPAGDWTVRVAPDVLAMVVVPRSSKPVLLHMGEVVPADLWTTDPQGHLILTSHATVHRSNGDVVSLLPERRPEPWMVVVEPSSDASNEATRPLLGMR